MVLTVAFATKVNGALNDVHIFFRQQEWQYLVCFEEAEADKSQIQ
jgi:hypothetical protein